MIIRAATVSDTDGIRQVHMAAFGDEERRIVANLAVALLEEPSSPETLHFVAESENTLVGHVAFSPVYSGRKSTCIGYALAPLAVNPSRQRNGIGQALVEAGLRELRRRNVEVILVYGDPNYYARFGFNPERAASYAPPFALKYPFGWQAIDARNNRPDSRPAPLRCVEALNKPELW